MRARNRLLGGRRPVGGGHTGRVHAAAVVALLGVALVVLGAVVLRRQGRAGWPRAGAAALAGLGLLLPAAAALAHAGSEVTAVADLASILLVVAALVLVVRDQSRRTRSRP